MSDQARHDAWQAGANYDAYMGRWSRKVAPLFLDWVAAEEGQTWLDVGCGTGALSATILASQNPAGLTGIDPSPGFLEQARNNVADERVSFQVGDAQDLPVPSATCDIAVSGLMLNFVPDRGRALAEMARVVRPGGTVAFYVWDYPGGGVEFMRAFWTAAIALDPAAADLSEGKRFPFCTRDGLTALAMDAGLRAVDSVALETATVFRDFEDFWYPFTLGSGPAPGYCVKLAPQARERLRLRLEETLTPEQDGTIPLMVRAWAVSGKTP